jgi:uncharacterized membrane protein
MGVGIYYYHYYRSDNQWRYYARRSTSAGYGALFGLVAYATYDLTNLSTLKGFTTKLVLVDMLWGVCLTAAVSIIAYGIIRQWIS